jgi:predicted nuclease of predicted toxin-antitoxin system
MAFPLLFDEDASRRAVAHALRQAGVDALTAMDAGLLGAPDEEQLAFATAAGRALLTFNVGDFARLNAAWLARGRPHAGLILANQRRWPVGELVRRILHLHAVRSAAEMRSRLEYLSNW